MSKTKKTPIIKYGIEITKPFSKRMYTHNEMCSIEMKDNIAMAWEVELNKFNGDDEWPSESKIDNIVELSKQVMAVGYGIGYTIDDVSTDFLQELDTMANWQLHEIYSYLCFKEMVPKTGFMMLGFEWEKCEYGDIHYDGRFASDGEMSSPILEDELTDELEKLANPEYKGQYER